jgi:hypothetical protein
MNTSYLKHLLVWRGGTASPRIPPLYCTDAF